MYKNAYYPKIFTCSLSSLGRKLEEDGWSQVERVLTEKPWKYPIYVPGIHGHVLFISATSLRVKKTPKQNIEQSVKRS